MRALCFALLIALTASCGGSGGAILVVGRDWVVLAQLSQARTENTAAAAGGRVYVMGGFATRTTPALDVECYDPAMDLWTTVTQHPAGGVNHAGLVELGGLLYLIGGYSGATFNEIDDVRIYDPAMNQWSVGADMPTPRGALAVAVLNGMIHAIGGQDGSGELGTHEIYDPVMDQWSVAAPMPTPREHHAAAAVSGLIYVAAGRVQDPGVRNLDTFEIYDPVMDMWTPGPPVPTARSGIAAVASSGRFYLFGGEGPAGIFRDNESYDPLTGMWTTNAPMPTGRHGLGAAVIGNDIYVVGGGPSPGFTFSGANERFTPE